MVVRTWVKMGLNENQNKIAMQKAEEGKHHLVNVPRYYSRLPQFLATPSAKFQIQINWKTIILDRRSRVSNRQRQILPRSGERNPDVGKWK